MKNSLLWMLWLLLLFSVVVTKETNVAEGRGKHFFPRSSKNSYSTVTEDTNQQ